MSTRPRRRSAPLDRVSVAKDLILFTMGTALIGWQGFAVPRQDFNWIVMAAGGILAGVPGWLQLWGLRASSTDAPSLPQAGPESPSPSPPSSSG